jgi:hypothetical protein
MFNGHCNHCEYSWENATPNCPECGTPDPNANGQFDKAARPKAKKKPAQRKSPPPTRLASSNDGGGFRGAAVEAMKLGATMAVASEANNAIKEVGKKALVKAGVPELMLEGPVFEKGVPLVTSLLILYAAENFPDLVPKNDMVSKAAQLALSQATIETVQPLIQQVTPTLMALAASGEKLAALQAADEPEEQEAEIVEIDTDLS